MLALIDISRAYFNVIIVREVYVELPPEAGHGKGKIGRLVKCVYGTRDAAKGWEEAYQEALAKLGFRQGRSSACAFFHPKRQLRLVVRGDDFFVVGMPSSVKWFTDELLKVFEGEVKGLLDQAGQELRILNRIVRRTEHGYEWEVDQRHAELIASGAGLSASSKPMACPGRKLSSAGREAGAEVLDEKQASDFRAQVARANFMAIDRPDAAFAIKELCRCMSSPCKADAEALKRLARYLLGVPWLVIHFPWQDDPGEVVVFTNSDWAGCPRTRRSTSGGVLMRGCHLLRHWCTTQPTVALSSAEAELVSIVRGSSEGIGMRGLMEDLGFTCRVKTLTDAQAAIGICKRSGVGRVRHLDTRLWVQVKIRSGDIDIGSVLGSDNPSDLLAKHVLSELTACHTSR